MVDKVQIIIDGKTIDLDLLRASQGADVVDVRGLIAEGIYTYDPGFLSTAACDSHITYIDGDVGVLMYRGYPIEQLAEHSSHMEVCSLLFNGELPTSSELENYINDINSEMEIDSHFQNLFSGFTADSHPMSVICAATAGLASLYYDGLDITDASHRELAAKRLVAKMPTLAAMTYKLSQGEDFIAPVPGLSYAENFLHKIGRAHV